MKSKSKAIKLTGTSYAVLALLKEFGESTSYEIKQALESSIQNFWPVPHTTAYEEPARLAAAGYLSAKQEEGGRRRRVYSLTDKGREALAAWAGEASAASPQLRDELMLKVFAGADPGPLLAPRIAHHRDKLEELRGYLELVRQNEGFEGSERTLVAGVAYEEKMLEMLETFAQAAAD
ncbi:MAG TPA: PadR family transcriptional regulator [Solirubrobacterales bacterium]|nr:PadR family transcriptional regulator [Solirubrobacterales bacterium]